jgi:transposase
MEVEVLQVSEKLLAHAGSVDKRRKRERGSKVDKEQDSRARAYLVSCMQEGQSWQSAAASAGLQISQSNAYRLLKAFRQRGKQALSDGRHGHPSKLRGEARAFLETSCREAPSTPSSSFQTALQNRFDLRVSISQINRVRAALGVSNSRRHQEQKKTEGKALLSPQAEWQEGAGSLLLLAATHQTDLLTSLA